MGPIDPDYNHFNSNTVNFTSHSIDTFVRSSNLDPKALNILHHNSRSIMKNGKLAEYELFFKAINNPFGILIFTETWLTNNKKSLCKFDDFSSIHLLRPNDQHFDFKERRRDLNFCQKRHIIYT